MSKPRKKYQGPKYVARNVLTTFFGGMSTTHEDQLRLLTGKNAAAMAAMMAGQGTRENWDTLVGFSNMAIVLCEQGIGPEYRVQLVAAHEALKECGKRAFKNNMRFLFTGDEMKVVREALEIHDAQLTNIRAIDIDRASFEVNRRLRDRVNTTSIKREIELEAA